MRVAMEWIVPLVLAAGLAAPWIHVRLGDRTGPVLALLPAGIAAAALAAQVGVARGEVASFHAEWVPSLGLAWAFHVDGLANLLVLLVAGIGALVTLYAGAYLREHPRRGRFFAFLFVFMGAMLGIATADDLFLLFVFWELTTVASFLLIGFESGLETARRAAVRGLLVTAVGGLGLLAGLLLLGSAAGTHALSEIAARGDVVRADPAYPFILALVAFGAFTKSAQVPFHFWLPAAMAAPTPVSAYLHSSTMVKAGVFLLARLSPTLGGTEAWLALLGAVGGATLAVGAIGALLQDDLKRILAFSTLGVLGLLTMLLGLGTPIAARAFVVTLLAHALYKGALFLAAGNVDHGAGTRSVARLGGLRRAMPWTAGAAGAAALSMAGGPPLFGFLAKETAYEAVLEAPRTAAAFGAVTIAAGVCMVFAALRVGLEPFRGAPTPAAREAHDPSLAMRLGPVLLAGLGLAAGLLVGPAERFLVSPAASAILQDEAPTGLALWHGFTPILLLSLVTVATGAALFGARARVAATAERTRPWTRFGPERALVRAGDGLLAVAGASTRALQNGSLRRYLAVTLGAAVAAAAVGLSSTAGLGLTPAGPPASPIGAAAVLLVAGGAVGMLTARTPLVTVVALGAVGFGVSLLFLVYSAPDLALTQLVVEVLTVVLFAFVLGRLPRPAARVRPGAGAIGLATAGGLAMAALTALALSVQAPAPISGFLAENSVPLAHGRNVVNVILVDFRALDTLGEITVLAVAALGVVALLRAQRTEADASPRTTEPGEGA
jgi:multicomponent Na+:H+ antiporter subunit A